MIRQVYLFDVTETPDSAYPGGPSAKRLGPVSPDGRVFGFYRGRVLVAPEAKYTHYALLLYIAGVSLPDDPSDNWAKYRKARELMQPCGRVWLQHKFMSWWVREDQVSPKEVMAVHDAFGATEFDWTIEFLGDIQVPMMDFINQPARKFLGIF